jgi:hypothetical protein
MGAVRQGAVTTLIVVTTLLLVAVLFAQALPEGEFYKLFVTEDPASAAGDFKGSRTVQFDGLSGFLLDEIGSANVQSLYRAIEVYKDVTDGYVGTYAIGPVGTYETGTDHYPFRCNEGHVNPEVWSTPLQINSPNALNFPCGIQFQGRITYTGGGTVNAMDAVNLLGSSFLDPWLKTSGFLSSGCNDVDDPLDCCTGAGAGNCPFAGTPSYLGSDDIWMRLRDDWWIDTDGDEESDVAIYNESDFAVDGCLFVGDDQKTGASWCADTIEVDIISEATAATGVTIDGVLLKDSVVAVDVISEATPAAGVTIDGILLKDVAITVDVISELTPAAGVTIDGVLLKDSDVSAADLLGSGDAAVDGGIYIGDSGKTGPLWSRFSGSTSGLDCATPCVAGSICSDSDGDGTTNCKGSTDECYVFACDDGNNWTAMEN